MNTDSARRFHVLFMSRQRRCSYSRPRSVSVGRLGHGWSDTSDLARRSPDDRDLDARANARPRRRHGRGARRAALPCSSSTPQPTTSTSSPACARSCASPQRELTVHFPVKRDDGSVDVFTGYRVQHNVARGPAKGGLRFHPAHRPRRRPRAGHVDDLEVRPRRRAVRRRQGRRHVRPAGAERTRAGGPHAAASRPSSRASSAPTRDIPAPDVGTNAQVMAWIMDTVSMHHGYSVPGVVTGKPIAIGGSLGRADATGQGVVYTIEEAGRRQGLSLKGARVAVQGFGNVGEATARLLHQAGAVIVGDHRHRRRRLFGGRARPGVPAPLPRGARLDRRRARHAAASTTPSCSRSTSTCSCWPRSRARSRPTTRARCGPGSWPKAPTDRSSRSADPILRDNGVLVIPDILCNAGGVIVSYFEWVQNRQAHFWTLDRDQRAAAPDHRRRRGRGLGARRGVRGRRPPGRPLDRRRARRRGDQAARPLSLSRLCLEPERPHVADVRRPSHK